MRWRIALAIFLATVLLCLASRAHGAGDTASVRVRMPFRTLMNDQEYAKQRDLIILALTKMEELQPDDLDSFYQIGGIHGMPAAAYDDVVNETSPYNTTRWLGYCDHNGVIFPTWHRPYVLLIETAVRKYAMEIAETFQYQFGLNAYKAAAEELSWPYYDWAAAEPHPKELTDTTILVRTPPKMKWERVRNPFYSYTFQKDTTSGASYTENKDSPFWSPEGSVTLRYPYPDNETNSGWMSNQTFQVEVYNQLHSLTHDWVMNLFSIGTWECFSCRGLQITNPLCMQQSLESVHNWIHLYIGGYDGLGLGEGTGHMSLLQTAGFDPAFFLHHGNVDRLLALWQALWPGEWVIPGTSFGGTYLYDAGQPLNASSPLYPFKFDSGPSEGQFYTSVDVASTRALGYTFPELADQPSFSDLYAKLTEMYGPVRTGWRWYIHFNCTSTDPNAAAGYEISASFFYEGVEYTVDGVAPDLMSIATMQARVGTNFNGQTVLATETTRVFAEAGIPNDIAPMDGAYGNGPSEVPLPADAFPATCTSKEDSSVIISPCTCTKFLLWSWNADPTSPYQVYSGSVTPGLEGWSGTYTT